MRTRKTVLFAPLAVIAFTGAACGGDDDDDASDATTAAATEPVATTAEPATTAAATTEPATTAPAATTAAPTTAAAQAEPQQFMVMVDGRTDAFNGSFFGYFPDKVKVHPGDSIVYHSMFQGEPHSVAFGNLIDDAVSGFMTMTPEEMAGEAPPPADVEAAFALIPSMLPEGPGDAIQTSVNPCFVAEGEAIPSDPAAQCPVTDPAPFEGTEEFYNSGFLPDGEAYVFQLADDIPPGTYYAFCTLHFTEMISEITVVAADEPIPTPDDVAAEGQAQFEAMAAAGPPAIEEANATATPEHVHAGLGSPDEPKLLITEFVPMDVEAAAGDPVTFSIGGPHTVSFNAPESARTILTKGDDGGFHLVPEALTPAGYEPPPPPEGEPSSDAPPPPVDGGSWDGTGFFNSGILFGGDFLLRFTKPGTYEYQCLIHPEMQGTVTIT